MAKLRKRIKKWSLYKKSLVIFALTVLIIAEGFLIYVSSALKAYEKGDSASYMTYLCEDLKEASQKGKLDKYVDLKETNSQYEKKPDINKGYEELLKDSKLTFKRTPEEENTYDIYAGKQKLFKVKINNKGTVHKLGLLVYDKLETDSIKAYSEDGLYTVNMDVASGYTLYINDIKANKEDLKSSAMIKNFEEAYDYVNLPKLDHYEIKGLSYKPEIEVKDEKGNKVDIINSGDTLYAAGFKKLDTYEEAKKYIKDDFNPMDFAKTWSKFLTADLEHLPAMGLYEITPYTIEGTSMHKKAVAWATNVDIQFTSIHTLDSFTGEKLSNFTIYNENAFSVEVYLEKNMTLDRGEKKTDVMHDIFYYVYDGSHYKVVAMTSVAEK